jgi:threonine/homoserine/homoserine lactone efflux protein
MLLEGLMFGMIGQFTIGPVCLYIINTAISKGFIIAFVSAIGVTIADGVYILLALAGISGLSVNNKAQAVFRIAGGVVLLLFGLDIILGVFGKPILPKAAGPKEIAGLAGYFFYAFFLTMSNPITIIFWSGIFAAKISEKGRDKNGLYAFGTGAVLSTIIFLSAVSALGAGFHMYLPLKTIKFLNIAAGLCIVMYGILLFKPKQAA